MPGAVGTDEVKSLCVCVLYEWLNSHLYSVKICHDMKIIFKQVLIPVY